MLRIVIFAGCTVMASGLFTYQQRVPNGEHIPNPCGGGTWRGLGHYAPNGGGSLNPFGVDFQKYHTWTTELCQTDSDGDGRTNGEELGDPSCVWHAVGNVNLYAINGHPGICEPIGSPVCSYQEGKIPC